MLGNVQEFRIPVPFREFTNGDEFVQVSAENVGAAIAELWSRFPDIREQMIDGNGVLRRFVNIFVNKEDIRFLENYETPLKDGDQISVIPAMIDMRSAAAAIDVANRLRTG